MSANSGPLAVVVGSGASGGMVGRLLAKAGHRVVILEKGRSLFSGLGGPASQVTNNWANDEIAHEARPGLEDQDVLLEPRSFRAQGSSLDREFVGDVNTLPTTVGGGTTHYDAKARRLREVDFVANSLLRGYESPSVDPAPTTPAVSGTNYANWPMQYKHLEAFYAVSEEIVGVQGPAKGAPGNVSNENPYESWRSTAFPMPPGVGQLNSQLAAWGAESLGYAAPPVPTSVTSRPYRDGRPACIDCAFCLDFGCPVNAKGGGVWQVNEAIAAGAQLIPHANVTGFHFQKAGDGLQSVYAVDFEYRGEGPTYGPSYVSPVGGTNTIGSASNPIALLILANTPMEATRLSLMSGITPGSGLDPSGALGKNLMFHLQTAALAVVDQDIHSWRGRTSTHTLDAFAGAGPSVEKFRECNGAEIPRGGITELGGNQNPIQQASEVGAFIFGQPLKAFMSLAPFGKRLVAMTLQGEDMPQSANTVDLDPDLVDVYGVPIPRVTYSNHDYELKASAYYIPKMLAVLEAIGLPPSPYPIHPVFAGSINTTIPALPTGPIDSILYGATGMTPSSNATPFNTVPASRHILGTHRMALDPDSGIGPCDPYGRYWNFDNLYHAGGGLYVTAAGYNVTLTMWALAYWQAAAIITGMSNAHDPNYWNFRLRDKNGNYQPNMDFVAAKLRKVITTYDGSTTVGGFIASGGYDTFVSGK